MNDKSRKAPAHKQKPASRARDGRRQFGTVSAAILSVLSQTGSEMQLKAIHAEVERLLDGPVSFYSVADYLHRRSKGSRALFVRTRYGHYGLP